MNNFIRSGRLFRLPLGVPDLERFFLRRLFRKFNITYIPFTLRFYDRLYLREDKTRHNRALVNYCKKKGIMTIVVHEGFRYKNCADVQLPLRADYLLCPKEDYGHWCSRIGKQRVRWFYPQKLTEDYKGIVFLAPMYYWWDCYHEYYWKGRNSEVMKVVDRFLKEDVVFKLHQRSPEILKQFIPPGRIVEGKAEELIRKYNKIYVFAGCTIRKEVEIIGKKPIFVDDERWYD